MRRRHNAQCKSYGPHERRCIYPAGHWGAHKDVWGKGWQDISPRISEAELAAVELKCRRMAPEVLW